MHLFINRIENVIRAINIRIVLSFWSKLFLRIGRGQRWELWFGLLHLLESGWEVLNCRLQKFEAIRWKKVENEKVKRKWRRQQADAVHLLVCFSCFPKFVWKYDLYVARLIQNSSLQHSLNRKATYFRCLDSRLAVLLKKAKTCKAKISQND